MIHINMCECDTVQAWVVGAHEFDLPEHHYCKSYTTVLLCLKIQ